MLVTRAPGQASALAERLQALGAEPVLIPALEIVAPHSHQAIDDAIAHLFSPDATPAFDWLLFSSANAVASFADRLREQRRRTGERLPPTLRIAVIGAATAEALRTHALLEGSRDVLMPRQAVAESFATALLPYVRQQDGRPTRFLLVRAEEARDVLPETLRVAGAEVTIAPAYRTVIPQASVEAIRELLAKGDKDDSVEAITFTSSSSVRNLLALCQAAEVKLPTSALHVSIGPITSTTMREHGLPVDAEAPEATVLALAVATIGVLERGRQ